MRLSTMTSFFYRDMPDGRNYIHCINRAKKVGFDVLDFNMCLFAKGKSELLGEDWMERTQEIADEAARIGIEFSQAHLPFPTPNIRNANPKGKGGEKNEMMRFYIERAIRVAAILGVKWGVIHPVQNIYTDEQNVYEDIRYNHEIYDGLIEIADSLGVGIAYENMADIDGRRRFGSTPEELLALIESYNSPNIQICWDFGHVNRMFNEQTKPLKKIGKHLVATHVDDNIGKDDLHTLPYFGTLPWADIMRTLKEIGYSGDFNYEVGISKRVPEELLDATGEYVLSIGKYLIGLYRAAALLN